MRGTYLIIIIVFLEVNSTASYTEIGSHVGDEEYQDGLAGIDTYFGVKVTGDSKS